MKIISLILLVSLYSNLGHALQENIDSEYCSTQYYECTDSQRDIVSRFWQGVTPSIANIESVFSGTCTMVSRYYDPAHVHHGYVELRKQGNDFGFHAEFAYFYETNPYSDFTIADALKKDPMDSPYLLNFRENDIRIVVNETAQYQYFIRQTGPHQLVMIGLQGINDSIICDLRLNEAR
jgi:hypothetical protein